MLIASPRVDGSTVSGNMAHGTTSTIDNPLTITSPGPCGPGTPALDPGASVPITVDAGRFPSWKKLELYDGAKKLAEITRGPTRFTATNLTPGCHVFSVLGTGAAKTVRTSDPVMVVVRALPTDVPAVQRTFAYPNRGYQ